MRYTNCSYVDGNLELTGLTKLYDLSFLQHIEEVDGYVIVVNVFCHYLHLKNLRIIRVKQLHDNKYSLYIVLNHNPRNDNEGLMELQFVNLKEIMGGMVFFHNNNLLCFENSIRWDDINPTQKPPYSIIFDSKNYRRPCPQCDHKCYNKVTGHYHCWGTGEHMCQQLNYIKGMCSDTCDGRCFGPDPNQCCHSECAAGCTSQKKTECVTCKNFYNEGECHPFCPKMEVYDSRQMKWVDNPNGRYSFGSLCVKECPEWLTMARTLRSSIREKLQEEFLCCKICLEPYRQPKALPCLHSFCENCLRDYVRRHTGSCLGYFPCPMCRRDIRVPYGGIKHFQDNFLLSNLSDTLEEDDTWQDLHHCRLPTPKSLAQTSPLEEEFRDHKRVTPFVEESGNQCLCLTYPKFECNKRSFSNVCT